jgi:hypothetical protein
MRLRMNNMPRHVVSNTLSGRVVFSYQPAVESQEKEVEHAAA